MAKNSKPKNKKPVQQKVEKKSVVTAAESSRIETIISRVGLTLISVIVLVVAAVFIINSFSADEDVVAYDDYVHITATTLDQIVKDNGEGQAPGDREYFYGVDSYKDLLSLMNSNDMIYLYFYRSSDFDGDVQNAILEQSKIAGIPTETLIDENSASDFQAFIFIDLDAALNSSIFEDAELALLDLDQDDSQTLVIFDQYNIDGQYFESLTDSEDIIEVIEGLV